jgi:glycosyltransferase involved in cell wall biosynthesis
MSDSPQTHICITIMDDPLYKQSCIRVATALGKAGYRVTFIGRRLPGVPAPASSGAATQGEFGSPSGSTSTSGSGSPGEPFQRVRFRTLFKKGKLFYAEMNLRIFLYLLFHQVDLICCVNLDTIVPGWVISRLKCIPRIYDARELYTELPEIVARPGIQKIWLWVERSMVPRFPQGYAVCASIAEELERRYKVRYAVVRNMTVLQPQTTGPPGSGGTGAPGSGGAGVPEPVAPFPGKYLLYQGAVNYGRGLDELVEAMAYIDLPLVICGTGNYFNQCRELALSRDLGNQIHFTGQLQPQELKSYTSHAFIGINLVAAEGFNQYYSLPNKLFDYIHAGLPQVTMDYPEYQKVQAQFPIGILIPAVKPDLIVGAVKKLLEDPTLYAKLKINCLEAKTVFNWQREEPVLLEVFRKALEARRMEA